MTRLISFLGGSALAVATLLASGPAAYAQHHGGGGMSGGAHYGGGYGGGYRGGYGGGYGGGYRGGYGYGRYGYGYGYPGFGLYLGLGGLGYGGYYGGDYGYGYPYDYGYAPGYGVQPNYAPAYAGGVQTQSAYQPTGASARVVINVPADAQVWVDNYPINQTGTVRDLTTPPALEPGKVYHYTIKAQWNDNGKAVAQERTVNVEAGKASVVDFTAPPAARPATTPPVTPPVVG